MHVWSAAACNSQHTPLTAASDEGLGWALYRVDARRLLSAAGFADPRVVTRRHVQVIVLVPDIFFFGSIGSVGSSKQSIFSPSPHAFVRRVC